MCCWGMLPEQPVTRIEFPDPVSLLHARHALPPHTYTHTHTHIYTHTHTHTHTASAQPPVLECVEQAFCWAGTPAAGASRPAPLPSQTHKIKMYCIHSYCLFVQNSDPKVYHNIMPSVRCWLELWFLMV